MSRLSHVRYLISREPWWAEFWSAVAATTWGIWVYVQPESFEYNKPYRLLNNLDGNQYYWQYIAIFLGLAQLFAVCLDIKHIRVGSAFIASVFWFTLAWGVYLTMPQAPVILMYIMPGLANMSSAALLTRYRNKVET